MRHFIIAIALFILFGTEVSAQKMIKDKYVRYQVERLVFIRWNKFKPSWYFWLFHQKYKNGPDKRSLKQLLPTLAMVRITHDQVEKDREMVKEYFEENMYIYADRTLNKSYKLTEKTRLNRLFDELRGITNELEKYGCSEENLAEINSLISMYYGDIAIIRESFIPDAEKRTAFFAIREDLRELIAVCKHLLHIHKTANIYQIE